MRTKYSPLEPLKRSMPDVPLPPMERRRPLSRVVQVQLWRVVSVGEGESLKGDFVILRY